MNEWRRQNPLAVAIVILGNGSPPGTPPEANNNNTVILNGPATPYTISHSKSGWTKRMIEENIRLCEQAIIAENMR